MMKQRAIAVAMLALMLAVTGSASAGEPETHAKPDLEKLCTKVWTIDYTDGRTITACKLKAPTEFQGCWCGAGDTRFDKNGRLVACGISRDYTFGDVTIPAPAWTHFFPSGAPQSFMLDAHSGFQGLVLKSGKNDWTQHLHENGLLRHAYLAQRQEIQGVLCARATVLGTMGGRTFVKFHDNGMLESCKLARAVTIDGHRFRKGKRIRFDSTGNVLPGGAGVHPRATP